MSQEQRNVPSYEIRGALVGGGVAVVALFVTIILIGRVGSFEAPVIIEAAVSTAHFFAAAAVGGSLTVLALLLTLLGLSLGSEYHFSDALYTRAAFLTRLSVTSIILGTAILLASAMPIGEVDQLAIYHDIFYYGLSAALSILGGLVISMGLLIGVILRGITDIGRSGAESDLLERPTRS